LINPHRIDDEAFLMLLRPHLRSLVASKSLTMRSNLYHLGLDSTAALNLLLDLEERLGVAFPESLLTDATFETPAALKAALDSLTNETG
jgi:acyl carrier protein